MRTPRSPAILAALLLLIVGSSPALATDPISTCIFGDETPDLNHTKPENVKRMGDLGLTLMPKMNPQSADDVTDPLELDLILHTVVAEAQDLGVDVPYDSDDEAIADFIKRDGYIRHITGNFGNFNGFIVVAFYPGENEYGRIYGLKKSRRGSIDHEVDYKVVTQITDGFFEGCKVTL